MVFLWFSPCSHGFPMVPTERSTMGRSRFFFIHQWGERWDELLIKPTIVWEYSITGYTFIIFGWWFGT